MSHKDENYVISTNDLNHKNQVYESKSEKMRNDVIITKKWTKLMTSHFFDFCLGQLGFTNWKEVRVIHCLARRQPRLMIITKQLVQKVQRFVAEKILLKLRKKKLKKF